VRNTQLIDQTLRRWSIGDARVLQLAISDRDGMASFTSDPVSGATGSLDAEMSAAHQLWGESEAIEVRTLTLDTAAANGSVDMMKIDVEGHEEAVVRGARETIERSRPLIVFECFHGGDEICAHLAELGYEFFDAERLEAPAAHTSNFFCLPPQHARHREALLSRWRNQIDHWR
jgi:FkbM family methyltransferase